MLQSAKPLTGRQIAICKFAIRFKNAPMNDTATQNNVDTLLEDIRYGLERVAWAVCGWGTRAGRAYWKVGATADWSRCP